ncbi:MAG: hypothetical protein QM754_07945 [Tepidisphaeraceae bacterium]
MSETKEMGDILREIKAAEDEAKKSATRVTETEKRVNADVLKIEAAVARAELSAIRIESVDKNAVAAAAKLEKETENSRKLVERLEKQLESENTLINQRLTWYLSFQGLLFAAIAFTFTASASTFATLHSVVAASQPTKRIDDFIAEVVTLREWLSLLGIVSSCLTFVGVCSSFMRFDQVAKTFENLRLPAQLFPRIRGTSGRIFGGVFIQFLLPMSIMLVWWQVSTHAWANVTFGISAGFCGLWLFTLITLHLFARE